MGDFFFWIRKRINVFMYGVSDKLGIFLKILVVFWPAIESMKYGNGKHILGKSGMTRLCFRIRQVSLRSSFSIHCMYYSYVCWGPEPIHSSKRYLGSSEIVPTSTTRHTSWKVEYMNRIWRLPQQFFSFLPILLRSSGLWCVKVLMWIWGFT